MTTKRAIEIALREIDDQLACDDISSDIRKELSAAKKQLQQFIKVVYS